MAEFKNLEYEDGIIERFSITVAENDFAGTYEIQKPDGWDSINCVLNIDEEFFNVNDFILGETQKFKIIEYYDKNTFDIVKSVYDRYGGDGRIFFSWTVEKEGEVFDILGDGYQLNLNKYSLQYEGERRSIELEVKKRESNNKLLTREDVSVDLFSEKDLDDNAIPPLETVDFYYKEKTRKQSNFYFYTYGQMAWNPYPARESFFSFTRGDGWEIGDNKNNTAGYNINDPFIAPKPIGDFISTRSPIESLSAEFSNFDIQSSDGDEFGLVVRYKNAAGQTIDQYLLESSVKVNNFQIIRIKNTTYKLRGLNENESLTFLLVSASKPIKFLSVGDQCSIEIKSELQIPLRRAKMLMLSTAIERITQMYAGISLDSSIIKDKGGKYTNTAVSTGLFLRSFSDLYTSKKLKTSLKNILYDGAAPLMALGFDIIGDVLKVEPVEWFFKDVMSADFSNKPYVESETTITHDAKESWNELVFGSKKYSTGNKGDIKNFNTKLEAVTPIESAKNKFDKTTEFVIDDWKIQNMITENSTASRSSDDDLAILDLINVASAEDTGVLIDCIHSAENGKLTLTCVETPFDQIPIKVGGRLDITSGLNKGSYTILSIDKAKVTLDKSSKIETGTSETPIRYSVTNILKNRGKEGFDYVPAEFETASNIRHNPKFHLARWYGYFGSAFTKKTPEKLIKVTDYTNNGDITVKASAMGEIPGDVKMDADESIYRLSAYKKPLFVGQNIETLLTGVTFWEFISFYYNWRNDRGFMRVDSPDGLLDVYVFGDEAVDYNRASMELKVKGKIKAPTTKLVPPDNYAKEITVNYNSNGWDANRWDYIFDLDDLALGFDNIQILTLPDSGVLFIALHYGEFTPITQGKIIDAYAINEESLFKFKAEGVSDNQFIGNYETYFKVRGINDDGSTGKEITVKIKAIDSGSGAEIDVTPPETEPAKMYCFTGRFSPSNGEVIQNRKPTYFETANLGGTVVYLNEYGEREEESYIYADEVRQIWATKIISKFAVTQVEC